MGRGQIGPVVHQLRHLFEGRSIAGVSEWQLLHRYLEGRDEVAFEAIVSRHGPMVLGVCRRLLADARDVEDAFQATFLVLARKGGTLGEADPVGHWLYGVAYRVALRARASAARRRKLEAGSVPLDLAKSDDMPQPDLGAVLDQELGRLPAKYRAPVVLCYLEGQTHEEAARQLGWPLGTVKGRLARARDLLRTRLSHRGLAPGGMWAIIRGGRLAVPRPLLDLTIKAAEAGRAAGMVPDAVAALAAGSISTMLINKLKASSGLAVVLVLSTGAAVMAYQFGGMQGPSQPSKVMPQPIAPAKAMSEPVNDWAAGWPEMTTPPVDPKDKAINDVLEQPLAMNFPNETPIGDVLKYIKQSTEKSPGLPNGLSIYVDPVGLQNSDKTLADTITIELEETPLKHTLRLLLKQLSLTYVVRDGLLTVTSTQEDDQVTPFSIMEEKARRGELTREQYKQLIEALKLKKQVEILSTVGNEQGGGAGGGGFQ